MRTAMGMWRCECCNLSNPDGFDRCSYCGLSRDHTPDELQKYKLALPGIKSKDQNVWKFLLSSLVGNIFQSNPKFVFILIIGLLSILPVVKDNMLMILPFAMLAAILVWGYFYMKK